MKYKFIGGGGEGKVLGKAFILELHYQVKDLAFLFENIPSKGMVLSLIILVIGLSAFKWKGLDNDFIEPGWGLQPFHSI